MKTELEKKTEELALLRAAFERSDRAHQQTRDALIAERNNAQKLFAEAKAVNAEMGAQIERLATFFGIKGTAAEVADYIIQESPVLAHDERSRPDQPMGEEGSIPCGTPLDAEKV